MKKYRMGRDVTINRGQCFIIPTIRIIWRDCCYPPWIKTFDIQFHWLQFSARIKWIENDTR